MKSFIVRLRAVMLSVVVAVGAVWLAGCGSDGGGNPGGAGSYGDDGPGPGISNGSDDVVPVGAIKIASFADLCKIGKEASHPLNGTYELTGNIDASPSRSMNDGMGFEPIGSSVNPGHFAGKFYGKGYTISGLYINRPGSEYVGLFGYVLGSNAEISGVHLVDAAVTGGSNMVGGLAGNLNGSNPGGISKSSVSGGTITGSGYVGGLVGWVQSSTVTDCYSTATINGSGSSTGGLAGFNSSNATISRSYAAGMVGGSSSSGGLAGGMFGAITNSYSASIVNTSYNGGGLVGQVIYSSVVTTTPTITNSYAVGSVSATNASSTSIGGLLGSVSGSDAIAITSCYWNTQTTGLSTSASGYAVGKTTAQMQNRSTYTGWDFSSVWAISGGYPYLRTLGPTASAPLAKAAAVNNAFAAAESPMSEAEMERKARETEARVRAEALRHTEISFGGGFR